MELLRMLFLLSLGRSCSTQTSHLKELVIQSVNDAIRTGQTTQFGRNGGKQEKVGMENDVAGCTLWQHSLFSASPEPGRVPQSDKNAALSLSALRRFNDLSNSTGPEMITTSEELLDTWRSQITSQCIPSPTSMNCNMLERYRSADGTCNNIHNPLSGSSFRPHRRLLPPDYEDGIDSPRIRADNGAILPSARLVSNTLHNAGRTHTSESFTVMYMSFGQFLDHDLTSTASLKDENNNPIDCCSNSNAALSSACFPIKIPINDTRFTKSCMSFTRSAAAVKNGCDPDYRQQINQLTSYLDASNVYGSTLESQERLREKSGGRMRVSDQGDLLPSYKNNTCILTNPSKTHCFDAGDERNSEVPTLTTLHIAFLREHNRIANTLRLINRDWNDELVFQEVRKIVGALLQHIAYNEYLPKVIGPSFMDMYDLKPTPTGFRSVYNDTIDATVTNVFATAAFRFGHSQIPDKMMLINKRFKKKAIMNLEKQYFKPDLMFEKNGPEWLARWQVSYAQTKEDNSIQSSVRNFLFLDSKNDSLDLAALNMQRGRDHGLPSYNAWRSWCGLNPASDFSHRKSGLVNHYRTGRNRLSRIYSSPNDIDLYSGGLLEKHLPGALVGPTFACIISRQFRDLQKGDRFWYENDAPYTGFSEAQLNEIKKMTLSSILCTNLHLVKTQLDSFQMKSDTNQRRECNSLPTMDLTKWAAN
ncbi:Peroxidase-like protein [Mizuhopecten yessoensis]|uniref:Peroxidase-like protein n=1 Tax=Mizuhopecten yessoensis TaxID=6573 RepID=A0A210PYI7_MIZYE|nr:Peroxidase-like protein [Mizuhopecten yessoensis]